MDAEAQAHLEPNSMKISPPLTTRAIMSALQKGRPSSAPAERPYVESCGPSSALHMLSPISPASASTSHSAKGATRSEFSEGSRTAWQTQSRAVLLAQRPGKTPASSVNGLQAGSLSAPACAFPTRNVSIYLHATRATQPRSGPAATQTGNGVHRLTQIVPSQRFL